MIKYILVPVKTVVATTSEAGPLGFLAILAILGGFFGYYWYNYGFWLTILSLLILLVANILCLMIINFIMNLLSKIKEVYQSTMLIIGVVFIVIASFSFLHHDKGFGLFWSIVLTIPYSMLLFVSLGIGAILGYLVINYYAMNYIIEYLASF